MTTFANLPPEILEQILQYVSSEDIKSYREVSKYCRNSTLPIWNKLVHVKITGTDLRGRDCVRGFLGLVHSGEMVGMNQPFTNFILHGNFPIERLYFLEHFFIKCGPQIKSLNLKDCSLQSAQCIKQILFQACPNLSELTFWGCAYENVQLPVFQDFSAPIENRNLSTLTIWQPDGSSNGISFWMDLFRRIPCLKSLVLIMCNCARALSDIFTAIDTIRKEEPSQLQLSKYN